jgi:hypothetical protein
MYQVFVGTLVANITASESSLVLLDIWTCGPMLELYRDWFHDVRTITDLQNVQPPSASTVCFRKAVTVPHTDFNEVGREFKALELQCLQSPLFQYFADSLLSAQRLPVRSDMSSLVPRTVPLPSTPATAATATTSNRTSGTVYIASDGKRRTATFNNSTAAVIKSGSAPSPPEVRVNITIIFRSANTKLSGWSKSRHVPKQFFEEVVRQVTEGGSWTADRQAPGGGKPVGLTWEHTPAPVPAVPYTFRVRPRIVAFEDLTIRQQVETARTSQIMVGMHGAGLAHMVWMGEGAHVVEMEANTNYHYR